jgi:hypothetical protein
MKKLVVGLIAFIVVLLVLIYGFIPSTLSHVEQANVLSGKGAYTRMFMLPQPYKWLPNLTTQTSPNVYRHKDVLFSTINNTFATPTLQLSIAKNEGSNTLIVYNVADTIWLRWNISLQTGMNPIHRVQQYFKFKNYKNVANDILTSINHFLVDNKNIYGVTIKKTTRLDSTLIAIKNSTHHYPTVKDIYTNIEQLQNYAIANNAKATNPPMLHIQQVDNTWSFMVALPIDKDLPSKNNILSKRMLPGGKFLETENIIGGFSLIDSNSRAVYNYLSDFSYMSPAIPFQSLITDRTKVSDSTKWITKLYYPIY